MPTYQEFCSKLKLTENPFASFTTENESQRFSKIFVKPNDYETILGNFSQRNSLILTGDRGTGKTALIKDFTGKVNDEDTIMAQISDFSSLKKDYQLNDFYKFVIVNLSTALFATLTNKRKRISKLSKEEKLLLCYLLKNFVPQLSKAQLKNQISNIQVPLITRVTKTVGNFIRGILNYSITTGGVLLDDYIAKHFSGLPPVSESVKIREYFPELPIEIEEELLDQEISYSLIQRIISVAKNLGFERVLIVFDRVDEDARFGNDADLISEFIKNILTDNKFFLEQDLQVIFSTWSTPFNYIKDAVRTQKHYCPTLSWSPNDLKKALNQRLAAFSDHRITSYKDLFASDVLENDIDKIFKLANGNPRDLWHIYNALLKSQFELNPDSDKITNAAVPMALINFTTTFNYYEYYPRKSNARANSMDIYSYSKHLLKLDSEIFTKNQLNEKAQTGGSTNNYVTNMERIGLIEIDRQQNGTVYYKIKDPKIVYALKNNLEIKRD